VDRAQLARMVVAVDAVGCLATSIAVRALPSVFRAVDPSLRSRPAVASALVGTAGVLALGLTGAAPTRRQLSVAALANAAWAVGCVVVLPGQRTATGRALVAGTGMLDAGLGSLQWALRPARQR
jgi:hypothetical protein